jgi:HAE1 family hydrophobic/amphiphilic exporter-1
VVFAVIAATLSLVSIFAPVIFISGHHRPVLPLLRRGRHLRRAGVAVRLADADADALLALPAVEKQHGPSTTASTASSGASTLYRACSTRRCAPLEGGGADRRRWPRSAFFFANIGKAFAPEQDEGRFLVSLRTPLGSSIDYTDARCAMVEAILNRHPEIVTEFALIGLGSAGQVNQGTVVVRMAPRESAA